MEKKIKIEDRDIIAKFDLIMGYECMMDDMAKSLGETKRLVWGKIYEIYPECKKRVVKYDQNDCTLIITTEEKEN